MKKLLFFFAVSLMFCVGTSAQQNIAPQATAAHSGGGANNFGPQNYNDGVISVGTAQPWGWVSSNGWIEYTWPAPVSFQDIVFWDGGRQVTSGQIQIWDAGTSSYVTVIANFGPLLDPTPGSSDSVSLPTRVTTTRVRFNQLAGANPNFREIQVYEAPSGLHDAGVSSIPGLVAVCPGTVPVTAVIRNFGINPIDSVLVNWEVNGVAQPSVMYNAATLDTVGGVNPSSAVVTLGNITAMLNTNYNVRAWTSLPNNAADTTNLNDTSSATLSLGAPSGLAVGNLQAFSADIFWNAAAGTNYEVIYGTSGFNPQSAGTSVLANASPRAISSLTPNTLYDAYVIGDCGGGLYSDTAGPVTFFTPCVTFTAPFTEDFDSTALGWVASGNNNGNGISQCWTSNPPTSSTTIFKWIPRSTAPTSGNGPLQDHTGGNFMYCEASGSGAGNVATLTSPPVDVSNLTTPAIYFHQHRFSNGGALADMEVEVTNDGGLTWTSVYNVTGEIQTSTADPFELEFVNLAAYTGDTIQVRFIQNGNGCCGDAALDNVVIDEAPICPWPVNLRVNSITDSNAIVAWDDPSGNKWDLSWGPCGFLQGSPGTFSMTTTTNPDTLFGLTPNTCYDFYVRANCTDSAKGVSLLIGPFSFRTACTPFTATYTDDFDSYPRDIVPFCWSALITGNGIIETEPFSNPNTLPNHMRMWNSSSGGATDTTMLISPKFSDMTASDKRIQFNAYSFTNNQPLIIGSMSNPLDASSFNAIDTVILTNGYNLYVVNLDAANGYNGTDEYVGFLHGNGGTFRTIFIDDFVYELTPLCNPPLINTLGVFGITATTANLYWGAGSDGDETHYEVGSVGFTPGTGTFTVADSVTGSMDTAAISGLTAQTTYDVYIRDSCATGGYSPWVGPITLTTKCVLTSPATLPFVDGFETYTGGPFQQDQDFCFPSYYWDYEGDDPGGRLRLAAGAPFVKSGVQAMTLDHAPAPSTTRTNWLTLAINLSNYTTSSGIELNFSYMSHAQESHPENRVWVRGSANDPWVQIYDLDVTQGQNGQYFDVANLDIVGPLANAGQTVGANTQIRFGQTGRFSAFNVNFSDGFTFDDVSLVEVTCPTPTGLNAINVVDTGATLTWNSSTSAIGYQVWFGPNGFYQGTQTLGGTKVVTTNPQLVLDTLRSKFCYEYVIRYICGPNDSSFYAGPYDFCTPCSIFNAPFVENFDGPSWIASGNNAGNSLDGCWSSTPDVGQGNIPFKWIPRATGPTSGNGPLTDNTGGNFLYCEASGSAAGQVATLISPIIDLGSLPNPALFFDQHRNANGGSLADMDVDISTDLGNTWTTVYDTTGQIQTTSGAAWVTQVVDLTPYAGDTIIVRFVQTGNGCCGDAAIDHFVVKDVVAEDLRLIGASFEKTGKCLRTNDTISIDVANNIGNAVNFATDNLVINYDVTGPVNTTGSLTINSGTLPAGDTTTFLATNIDLSQPGNYSLNVWIDPNSVNLDPSNDTLGSTVGLQVFPVWEVIPDTTVIITNTSDTACLEAKSPFLSGNTFFFTEMRQFASTGSGITPPYLTADDYCEITGVPGSDLDGITLQIYNNTNLQVNYTFPPGTVIGPNGTCIIMTGQGGGASQPANFMYDGRGGSTASFSSGSVTGYILRDGNTIIDAAACNGFNFPAASGVTAADWTGTVAPSGGTAGTRLTGPDINSATNWAVASTAAPQNAQVVNAGVTVPAATSTAGFSWTLNGSQYDTLPKTVVGPYTQSGVYNYIASYNGPCGLFSDTVTVIVNLPGSCPTPVNLAANVIRCDSVDLSWNSGADSSVVSWVTAGGTPTNATLVVGDSSLNVTGLTAGTAYDFYVFNICNGDSSNVSGPFTFNTGNVGAPVASFTATQPGFALTLNLDASSSTGDGNTYSWDFGDGNTGTGLTTSHNYTTGGVITVTLIVTNACGSDTATFTTAPDFSFGENELARNLVLYPNPATDQVQIRFDALSSEMTLRVLDLSGKEIISEQHNNLNGKVDHTLSLSDLADGVYMIEVSNGELTATKRLIKQ